MTLVSPCLGTGWRVLLAATLLSILTGCSARAHSPPTEAATLSRAQSRAEVFDLYSATKDLLRGSWEIGEDDWLSCTTPSGAAGEAFGFLSQRLEQPLGLTPSVATGKLQELWERQGVKASLSIRRSGVSPEYILSDPPFGAGAYEDGFAIQLTMSENAVTFNGSGRCVPAEDDQA